MKSRHIHIFLSILFSAAFLFAGTGYNVAHFCCNECEEAGIEVVAETSCMSVHEHFCHDESTEHHHGEDSMSCLHELQKGCDLERFSVDVPTFQASDFDFLDYTLLTAELGSFLTVLFSADESLDAYVDSRTLPYIPIRHQEGRQILSKISILRI